MEVIARQNTDRIGGIISFMVNSGPGWQRR